MNAATVRALGVPLALVVAAAVVDLRKGEIPDTVPILLLVWAVVATAFGWSGIGWVAALAGLVLGFAFGALLFRLAALGGGDVKLVAALGAVLGYRSLIYVLVYVALAGAVLALIAGLRGRREFAYGPAIALGFTAFMLLGGR